MSRSLAISVILIVLLAAVTASTAQDAKTQGPCSPIIDKTQGPVTITFSGGCTTGISPDQIKEIVDSVLAKRAIPPELLDR